jgi:diadenosine tetraphosphate (Ap4A) HIT family hydrolase
MNYELLGNQVPHLHWHLFPRYAGDAEHLKPVWVALERAEHDPTQKIRLQGDAARRGETIAELQRALTDLGALRA